MTTEQAPQRTEPLGDNGRAKTPPPPGGLGDLYRSVLPAVDFAPEQTKIDVALTVAPGQLHNVLATGLRHPQLRMDFLRNMTAVDWEERGLEVVYHLYSHEHRHSVAIKVMVPAVAPALRSVTDLYRTAEWMERECREMFGVEFEGLADRRNLLLDEDLDIHPLRKSHALAEIQTKQGVDVEYFTKEHPPTRPESPKDKAAKEAVAAKAAAAKPERKPEAELTDEERAANKAAQAERVKRGRELAAARRAEKRDEGGS